MIVDCAVYEDGRRRAGELGLDGGRARPAGDDGAFVWLGLYEPTRGGVRRRPPRVRPARARRRGRGQRAPAPEARGLRRHAVRRAEDRSATSTPRRSSRPARSCCSSTATFVITVRHGEAAPCTTCAQATREAPGPAALRHRRGALRDRRPRRRRLRAGRRRALDDRHPGDRAAGLLRPTRDNPAERIYTTGARGARVPAARSTPLAPRDRPPRPRPLRPDRRRSCATYFRDVHDHLLRGDEPDRGLPRPARERAPGEPHAGRPCARTRTCARSRRGSRSSPCRRRSPASTA